MKKYILWLVLSLLSMRLQAQQGELHLNLASLDGIEITKDNIIQYQIASSMSQTTHVLVEGTLRYRKSDLRISYRFEVDLLPGINNIRKSVQEVSLQYSSNALKELFEYYGTLPQGLYEYCVRVVPNYNNSEKNNGVVFNECLYNRATDLFLISLLNPENKAKIYEYQPLLSWVANYAFASQLEYKIRVAEILNGQNATVAINRNNPVYQEQHLQQTSIVYPVYAKPLKVNQPYAWTVDAYYKGILLGGAEPWIFTIVEDSALSAVPRNPAYVDIKKDLAYYDLYAPGILKLKYELKELKQDTLSLTLLDQDNKMVKLPDNLLNCVYGDNRFIINFHEDAPLKHLKSYQLNLQSQTGNIYRILFKYVNPELIK
jgi:hypothetical protein